MLKIFSKKQKGANLVEYALLAALIAIAAIATMQTMGTKITSKFSIVNSVLQ